MRINMVQYTVFNLLNIQLCAIIQSAGQLIGGLSEWMNYTMINKRKFSSGEDNNLLEAEICCSFTNESIKDSQWFEIITIFAGKANGSH